MKKTIFILIFLMAGIFSHAQKKRAFTQVLKDSSNAKKFGKLGKTIEAEFTVVDSNNVIILKRVIYKNHTWKVTIGDKKKYYPNVLINDKGETYYLMNDNTWRKK